MRITEDVENEIKIALVGRSSFFKGFLEKMSYIVKAWIYCSMFIQIYFDAIVQKIDILNDKNIDEDSYSVSPKIGSTFINEMSEFSDNLKRISR